MSDRLGQQLGNYRLVALLGQGGYAEVYLGQHMRLSLQAAIKVLHTHLTDQEAEHFYQEAETIAKLMHPAIVRILDYDVQDGVPFLVMDYAPNGSLRRRYPKGSVLLLPQIVSYVKQVAAALQYAHERKFIHRDVKPENMLLGRQQEVLLSDFGLAALAHSSGSLGTQEAVGTLTYMAPEQIEGHPRAASDQYALGVVVYEWLCGSRPFEGSVSEVMVQHLRMPPPPLRERIPTLSAEIEQVVLQALAKDPTERFACVQDFALALEEACRTEASSGQTFLVLSSASPAQDRYASKHNLPAQLTSLLGREHEVAAACALLRRPEVRLLTLTGTGGVGKTRLALQVGDDLLADFPDGVYFVSLAPISDSALVIPTIAHTFDLKETAARPLLDLLKASLRDKHLLLLLDNFEQVLPAALHLTDLLTNCPHLTILVTSRATLHVGGEHEFPVPPLTLPDLNQLPPTEALSSYPAVALFVSRAQATKPTFHLTSTDAHAIAEICVQLDGLPLAIELAAARSKLLPPQALLTRLEHRLTLLTSGGQDAPVRQQTLRNTLAWSYDLLSPQEQRLFRQLSVFVGGFTLEAVEAVCKTLGDEPMHVLEGVASLLDKNLVHQTVQEREEEPRFVLLETIREYGLERLAQSGETEATREAHAAYYLALAEEAEPHLKGAEQIRWFARLEQERENLRMAISWLLERARMEGQAEEGREYAKRALRLCVALLWFWYWYGYFREGWSFLEQALTMRKGVDRSLQARTLSTAGFLLWQLDNLERAEALAGESLALYRELGDTAGVADALLLLAAVARNRSQYALSRSQLEEAKALFQHVGDTWKRGQCLTDLARIAIVQGEYDRARALLEENLAFYRALGDQLYIAWVLYHLACLLFESQSDLTRAAALAEQSLALNREADATSCSTEPLGLLGEIHLVQGEQTRARERAEESLAIERELGTGWGIALASIGLARILASQDDRAAARALYQESLALLHKIGNKVFIAVCLEGLGAVVTTQGTVEAPLAGVRWAAHLWGAAETLRQDIGAPLPPVYRAGYEQAVTAARSALGEKAFAAALAEGRTMTPELALASQGREMMPKTVPGDQPPTPPAKSPPTYPAGLTAREVEVLCLVAQGLTDAQVAEQLVISPRTVNNHLTSIYQKIQVSSRSAATRYAVDQNLV